MTGDLNYRPVDAATGWIYCLTDPLIPLSRARIFEDAMGQVSARHPRWMKTFIAGATTSIMGSLPPADPWRHLSCRVGQSTIGPQPPAWSGSVTELGSRFGTLEDALDLVTPVFEEPESDPQLAPVADPMTNLGSAILACAGHASWRDTLAIASAVYDEIETSLTSVPSVGDTQRRAGYAFRDVGREALVWAMYRRRCYLGPDDPWVLEALLSWASRAGRVVAAEPPPHEVETAHPAWRAVATAFDAEVTRDMARERIPNEYRSGPPSSSP